MEEKAREMKLTVLHRPGGRWHHAEMLRLFPLSAEVASHPQHTEYIILLGHHTKEKVLEVLLGGQQFTATQVTGIESKGLPFIPSFM